MQKNRKRIFTWILLFTVSIQVFWWDGISVSAEPAAIEAPSAVLLESSTGKVIFEQNARERRPAPTPNPWEAPRYSWRRTRYRPWRP